MTTALIALTLVAGLLAVAFLLIRRTNMAFGYASPAARRTAPACEVGQQLLMASDTSAPEETKSSGLRRMPGFSGGGPSKPKRKKSSGPSRRAFLRGSMAVGWIGVLGGFGGASLAMLWPNLRGGFGAVIDVGNVDEILAEIQSEGVPFEFPQGRSYLVAYDPADDPGGEYAELTGGAPLMALYQVCVHLGCKVPFCFESQWFECPCHGSAYNRWGEYRGGPAPRSLDRFAVAVNDAGNLEIDTSEIIEISRQAAVLDQPPEGPSCI